MSLCSNCENKENGCRGLCDMDCNNYKPKPPKKVTRVFLFETSEGWKPTEPACWTECPFSPMIELGDTCKFIKKSLLVCPLKRSKEVDIK